MLYRDCVVHHSFDGERSGGAQLIVRLGTRTAGRRRTTSRCLAGVGVYPRGGTRTRLGRGAAGANALLGALAGALKALDKLERAGVVGLYLLAE